MLYDTAKVGQKGFSLTIARLKQTTIRLISSLSPHIQTDGTRTFPENICLGSWNCWNRYAPLFQLRSVGLRQATVLPVEDGCYGWTGWETGRAKSLACGKVRYVPCRGHGSVALRSSRLRQGSFPPVRWPVPGRLSHYQMLSRSYRRQDGGSPFSPNGFSVRPHSYCIVLSGCGYGAAEFKGGKTKRVNMWSVWKWMIALVFKVLGWSRGEWAAKTKRLHRFTLGLHLSLVWTPFKWNALHWRWDRGDFGVLSSIALHGLLFPHIQR